MPFAVARPRLAQGLPYPAGENPLPARPLQRRTSVMSIENFSLPLLTGAKPFAPSTKTTSLGRNAIYQRDATRPAPAWMLSDRLNAYLVVSGVAAIRSKALVAL